MAETKNSTRTRYLRDPGITVRPLGAPCSSDRPYLCIHDELLISQDRQGRPVIKCANVLCEGLWIGNQI